MAEGFGDIPPRHTFDRLGDAVRRLKATRVLETGTNFGFSTRELSKALQETGGHLWTLDINPPIRNWQEQWPLKNITYVQHNALTWPVPPELQPLDLLFLDDAHTYRHLLQELRRFGPLVREGGEIFVDDPTHCDGITTHEMNCGLPVLWATALWCREVGLAMTVYTEDACGIIHILVTKTLTPNPLPDARIHGITGVATIINSTDVHGDEVFVGQLLTQPHHRMIP